MKRVMIPFVLLATLPAAMCQSDQPGIEVRTVEVVRTVPIACVKREDIPAEPPKIGAKLTGDPVHDLDVVSASALRLRAWGQEMSAMLQGCAQEGGRGG